MTEQNRQMFLVERPWATLDHRHCETRTDVAPAAMNGQTQVRTLLLSLDVADRAWMQGEAYRKAMNAGEVTDGCGIGVAIQSNGDCWRWVILWAGRIVRCTRKAVSGECRPDSPRRAT